MLKVSQRRRRRGDVLIVGVGGVDRKEVFDEFRLQEGWQGPL